MPPKTWDESSSEESSEDESPRQPVVAPAAARRKFDDEEDSDDAPDAWDDEDSEEEREKAKKAAEAKAKADALAAANKKSKAQRIEEHREANRRRRAAEEDSESEEEETEAERKARLKKQEKDSDLAHASDLVGDISAIDLRNSKKAVNKSVILEDAANPGQAIDLSKLAIFQPKTKTQFDQLSDTLTPLIRANTSKAHFPLWMPNFAKGLCQDMNSVDIKKVASALTALSNEKLKEEKAKDAPKKSKAKAKTTLAADRGIGQNKADTTAYDEDGLDDGDFM